MKITLKQTPEQVELVKAMASKNRDVAYEAQTALAEFIGPVLAEVVNTAPTVSNMFTSLQFNSDESQVFPWTFIMILQMRTTFRFGVNPFLEVFRLTKSLLRKASLSSQLILSIAH